MKKHMIIAALAALTLASCAKVETTPIDRFADGPAAIMFSNYAPRSITKADAANYASSTALINNADFDVYGWSTANNVSFNGSNGTQFMNWYTVTYQTGGNSSGITNLYPDGYRYWPSGDTPDKLSFYAYYPSNDGTITPPAGLGAFSFTAEAAAADMVDFMVADVVKDQVYDATNSGTPGTVNLTFRHMLTKVQFRFKRAIDYDSNGNGLDANDIPDPNTVIILTDAKIYNARTTGTLTSAYDGTDFTTGWSAQGTPSATPYEVYVSGSDIANLVLTKDAQPAAEVASDTFLMVPQTMVTPAFETGTRTLTSASAAEKPQYLEVFWTVKTYDTAAHATANGAEGLLSTTTNSKKLYFDIDLKTTDGNPGQAAPATKDLDWDKNQSIIYTITIGPKPILFTAEVAEWDDPDINGYFNVQ